MKVPTLVPELEVRDLHRSMRFYTGLLGFRVAYDRPDEGFAYLALGEAHLMLEQIGAADRRFVDLPPDVILGAGVNLQIEVADAATLAARLEDAAIVVVPLEDRWYGIPDGEVGNRQLVVRDPDGYLLRLFSDLGRRTR